MDFEGFLAQLFTLLKNGGFHFQELESHCQVPKHTAEAASCEMDGGCAVVKFSTCCYSLKRLELLYDRMTASAIDVVGNPTTVGSASALMGRDLMRLVGPANGSRSWWKSLLHFWDLLSTN